MPQISPEFLIRSFQKLTNTQENMQSLALFIRLNKTEHNLILDIYSRELKKSNVYHKLTLYYLANEILQTERDTDEDALNLVQGLKRCVVDTFKYIEPSDDVCANYNKLKQVWLTRNIFDESELGESKTNVDGDSERFGREEFLSRVNRYFDEQEEFTTYLKEFVDHINK